ncbi:hypothetical protein [Kitasatospora purpeofusca]|uniref:hypothetical protein n=1 Tax=Kitasatospora purpeofusca TaxID=67352 RepID=UPI00386CCBE7|nr:hypothetical protein OIP63_26025 [Kitasatospora purpeofusca]
MSDAVPVELSATEALGLAARARAAAQAPQLVPTWYGATFAAGFSLYGLGVGCALWADASWLAGVLGAAFAAASGALGAVVTRRGGVARGWTPGYGGPMARWVALVLAGAFAVAAAVHLLGADARGTFGSAGVTVGALFWLAMVRVNARIRRQAEGA